MTAHLRTRSGPRITTVVELEPHMRGDAAKVLADAFFEDPAWIAIGPRRGVARRRLLADYYRIVVDEALRSGGPHWCAVTEGAVAGVALTYSDGREFPPPYATFREAPPFLRAGPGPGLRAAYVDFRMKRAHPAKPHRFLWNLAAQPELQRQGIGRSLLLHVCAQADAANAPIYLDTTKAQNVAYYRTFGFSQVGEARLLRGARVWFMYRENGHRADPMMERLAPASG
jgi:ribosomal protein S18 acetylase RimI-like enzyme